MTYYCAECHINWWPYQTNRGTCLRCGSGTKRTQDGASADATERYREVMGQRASIELRDRFEEYYFKRELARGAEDWKTP